MNLFSQGNIADREPVAAGRFYSSDREALKKDIALLFSNTGSDREKETVRALIAPHAGYVFSGKTAASALATIPPDKKFDNIFIIGSSHVMAFDGASAYNTGDYKTPLGTAKVNTAIARKLAEDNVCFRFPVTAHSQEHSIEVQVPLIQYYFKEQPEIVPVIIGTDNRNTIKKIAEALRPYFKPGNLFLISSDFSHYPSYSDANTIDRITADALISNNPETFLSTLQKNETKGIPGLVTSMCGWSSGLTLLYLTTGDNSLEYRKVSYCNSGDSKLGGRDEVVGYNALVLVEKPSAVNQPTQTKSDVEFTEKEKDLLFEIARSSIRSGLYEGKKYVPDQAAIPPALKQKMGAFVTLKINGELRGCIGRFTSNDPLFEVVNQMASASAFDDGRFNPLTKEEFKNVELEISVLGPLKRIKDISELVLGKHGIYIKKEFRSGTMLPQVATENNWTAEQFLGYTSREKAGLGWDGWKTAELYIYEAVVLEERKK